MVHDTHNTMNSYNLASKSAGDLLDFYANINNKVCKTVRIHINVEEIQN